MEDDKSDPISIEFEGHPDSRLVLKNFDPTRWSQVETSDDDTAWKVILTGAGSLILLSGYGAENDPSDFPFDERGLPWIEKYLDTLVKPYVRKWGKEEGGLEVLKVRNKHGMDKHGVETRFAIAAFVLLQCLAQQHGKLIAKDGFASFRLEDGSGAMGKVRKYVKFGYEDSLVIYSKVIGNLSKTEVFVKSVEYLMAKRGLTNHRVQLWNDERGLPVMAKAVDNDTDEGRVLRAEHLHRQGRRRQLHLA